MKMRSVCAVVVALVAWCAPALSPAASLDPVSGQLSNEFGDLGSMPLHEVLDIVAVELVVTVDALAELDASRSGDERIDGFVADLGDRIAGLPLTSDDYAFGLQYFQQDWFYLLDSLDFVGADIGDALDDVELLLGSAAYNALIRGDHATVDPSVLLEAAADLLVRSGGSSAGWTGELSDSDLDAIWSLAESLGAPLPFVDTVVPEIVDLDTVDPGAVLAETVVPETTTSPLAVADVATESDPAPIVPFLVAGLVLGCLIAASFVRRSRSHSANTVAAVDFLDASRRMTATFDPDKIAAVAVESAIQVAGATAGLLVVRDDLGIRVLHTAPPATFWGPDIQLSSLHRALETGQSSITTLSSTTDAVKTDGAVSLAIVPIVTKGAVLGAIVVGRPQKTPFGDAELEALEMLAPMAGSALGAAADHGSATRLVDVEPMTGLKNRRCLDRDLADIDRGSVMSYFMIDIDHFKNFNDTNGHAAGDEALCRVATLLSETVRAQDVVYRYGGEEFCVLLPGTTAQEAVHIAERVRSFVEAAEIPGAHNQPLGRVTLSIGVADTSAERPRDLLERADVAMYAAKKAGRNRVHLAS